MQTKDRKPRLRPARSCARLDSEERQFNWPGETWPCERLAATLAICWGIIRRWTPPSNRSRDEWLEEIQQVTWTAAFIAESELPLASGIDFDVFIRRRILGSAFAYYRREVTHSQRFLPHSPAEFEGGLSHWWVCRIGVGSNHLTFALFPRTKTHDSITPTMPLEICST